MGRTRCERLGKCPTGMIASTGLDGLHDLLSIYDKAGDQDVTIEITVKSPDESNSYEFPVKNIAELVEMLRLATGR